MILLYCWSERYRFHGLFPVARLQKYKIDRLITENKAAGHSVGQELARYSGCSIFGI